MNLIDLSFRGVTAVTLAAIAALCLFVVAVLPRFKNRTRETDAIEYAIVILLTVMFSPLSFNYAYVFLIYPMTLGLHLVLSEPPRAPGHGIRVAWIAAVFLIPALALPMPRTGAGIWQPVLPRPAASFRLGRDAAPCFPCPARANTPRNGPSRRTKARDHCRAAMTPLWHCLFSAFGQEYRDQSSEASSANGIENTPGKEA